MDGSDNAELWEPFQEHHCGPLPPRISRYGASNRKVALSGAAFGRRLPTKHRYIRGTTLEKPANYDNDNPLVALLLHPLNVLIVFFPLGICAFYLEWGELQIFWFNFFAMIPLAKILDDATEELAVSLRNDTLAGLVTATFGNAVEMVMCIQTLRAGQLETVKETLLGSVLSNTLLVLGTSFLLGGIYGKKEGEDELDERGFVDEKIQSFSVLGAHVNTSMLLISCMSFSLVTVFRSVTNHLQDDQFKEDILLPVSRISSIIIMCAYCAYMFFQLFTHKHTLGTELEDENDDDDEAAGRLSIPKAMALLMAATIVVSISSEFLLDAIDGVTEQAPVNHHFIGMVLLPIVGNACEHVAAVRFAMQDKLGFSVSIAVGSSTQIALFVVPFAVLMGWLLGKDMDMDFGALNTSMITLSVIVVLSMVVDGRTNWLEGYLLISVYAIIAVTYWYIEDDDSL